MKKLVLLLLLTATAAIGLSPNVATAQVDRGSETVYIRPRVGISYYMGDSEKSPVNFDGDMFDKFPYNAGLELGYQFTPSYSVGLAFRYGDYTTITDFEIPTDTRDHPTTRWGVSLLARKLMSSGKIAPYWAAGINVGGGDSYVFSVACANNVVGSCVTHNEIGFGLSAGFGLDFYINPATSFFIETGVDTSRPDDAADGSKDNGFTGMDFLGHNSFGLKINFNRVTPVEVADLICPVEAVDAGSPVTFTGSVNAKATQPVSYLWTFGDETTAEGMTVSHSFPRAGDYTVGLTASNGNGKYTSTKTCAVTVKDPCLPSQITSMRASNMSPDTQTAVAFSANVNGTKGTYRWDMGDGTKMTGEAPSHTYSKAGTYTVTLEIENCAGVVKRTMTITVNPYEAAICREITEMNAAYFARNSSALTDEGRAALKENLDILLECPNLNVRVEGWASAGERKPQELSEDRARAVEQFYVDNGVSASRLVTTGMGRAGTGSKKDGLSQFRRVDTIPVR